MTIYSVRDFPYDVISSYGKVQRPRRARGKRYERDYLDVVCAFDIEATNIKRLKQSVMYVWQFAFDEYFVVMGRTWSEFKLFMDCICDRLPDNMYLCVYVHNLSYEFEYLQGQFEMTAENVFAVKARKVLNARILNHIEFRCSYLQSNMSLKDFTKKLDVKHKKLEGAEYDYSKPRYYYTPLAEREIEYCVNDVIGVVECIKKELEIDNDTLYTIPMTSTGYVRRDVKKAYSTLSYSYRKSLQPNYDTYIMLRKAFRGGNTHANRYYVCDRETQGQIFDNEDVITMDMSSAYPAAILNGKFPISAFKPVEKPNAAKLEKCINVLNLACLIYCRFENIRLQKSNWGCPYIPRDKCNCIIEPTVDNGRILRADSLEMWLTDIDYNIIKSEYYFDNCVVYQLQVAKYGSIPEPIKEVVRKYYRLKTELKDVKNQEIYYVKEKNKLNAIYGMFAQDPVIFDLSFDTLYDTDPETGDMIEIKINNRILKSFTDELQRIQYPPYLTDREKYEMREKIRREMIKQKIDMMRERAAFPYQWGVWITALCRQQLERGIQHVYKYYDPFMCYFVYTDTDSIKYSDPENRVDWTEFNSEIEKVSRANGGVAKDKNKKEHVIGVYEREKFVGKRFRTLGAKRYVYEDQNGELHVTISGVNKYIGVDELKELGGLNAFKDGLTFKRAGGQCAYYNDCGGQTFVNDDGVEIEIPPNIYLEDTTKTIKRGYDYTDLTKKCAIDFINNFGAFCEYFNKSVDTYDNI